MATVKRPLSSTERLAPATKIPAACFAKSVGSSFMIMFRLKDISVIFFQEKVLLVSDTSHEGFKRLGKGL